jgi:GntR family transcriptional regulator, arabinose operon transcriptional repressor
VEPRSPDTPPKYRQVYDALVRQITAGRMVAGARLPSEADLVKQFGASRITVGRALRDLQVAGLVERRAGSGTFVRAPRRPVRSQAFGVLMPDLGEVEVFDAICRGLLDAPEARQHVLVWGSRPVSTPSKADQAWHLCEQYVDRQVDGVFFAPMEHTASRDAINHRIAEALAAAGIPVVLIDRAIEPYPRRGRHDLVALDNRRAGAVVTDHLLDGGCLRLAFLGLPHAASSVDGREAGFRDAIRARGLGPEAACVWREDPADRLRLAALLERDAPDGIVCASDRTAAVLMHALRAFGRRVPDDLKLVGIDDVEYAAMLPAPLTTLRQPCREIGVSAMRAMLDRVAQPDLPPREILLHGTLVVRESCGQRQVEQGERAERVPREVG